MLLSLERSFLYFQVQIIKCTKMILQTKWAVEMDDATIHPCKTCNRVISTNTLEVFYHCQLLSGCVFLSSETKAQAESLLDALT